MLFSIDMMVVIVKGLNPGVIIFVSRPTEHDRGVITYECST